MRSSLVLLAATALSAAALALACGSTNDPATPPGTSSGGPPDASSSGSSDAADLDAGTREAAAPVPDAAVPSSASVSGTWRGKVDGDESVFLDLTQTGDAVTGSVCENPGKDCNVLTGGKLAGKQLTGAFGWDENGATETVTFDLALTLDGKKLEGTFTSTKCDCTMNASLTRQ